MDAAIDILLVVEADITTTQLIEQILDAGAARGIRTTKRLLDDLTITDFGPRTIPLFVRCGDPYARVWTGVLSDANRIYAYYIDDNFWHIVGAKMLAHYYRHPIVRRSLESSISHAHTVIAGSPELACFMTSFNPHVVVLPTFVDFSLVNPARHGQSTSELRIGFAGSPSRGDDLDLISPIIPRVLDAFPNAVFEFAGAFPNGVTESDRVRRFPHLKDYAGYVDWQRERGWLVGLAPLADHQANRSKTDNKYREYGAFGYAGIYSAIPPYTRVVKHDETGLLVANTSDAWFDAINKLLTKTEKREAIVRRASADVHSRYDIERVSEVWSQLFNAVAGELRSDAKPIDKLRLSRGLNRAFIERWRVHISLHYNEGGAGLVAKRAIRMIARRLARAIKRV